MGMFEASKRATETLDEKGPGTKPQEAGGHPGGSGDASDPQWQEHHSHMAAHHASRADHHEAMAKLHTKSAAHHNKEAAYHQGKC